MTYSAKPRKKRKEIHTLDAHKRGKLIASRLDKKLTKEHKKRSIPIRKDDKVKIVRGTHKGKTGKITRVDRKNYKIFIEGLVTKKMNGQESFIPVNASNVIVTELALNDEKRQKALKR